MKRVVSVVLVLVMVLSMTTTSFAGFSGTLRDENGNIVDQTSAKPQQNATSDLVIKSFSDVPRSHWAYDAIMSMARKGLVNGRTAPNEYGVAEFRPKNHMTRAEFITVIVRYLYSDEINTQEKGSYWYSPYYKVALDKELVKQSEFSESKLGYDITRQEMSMILVRAMGATGEDNTNMAALERIRDYATIDPYYVDYVRVAYQAGLIGGLDKYGTFAPRGILKREEASTVLHRLIEPSERLKPSEEDLNAEAEANGTVFKEGEAHDIPKAGDTVIKADGTKVVIKEGIFGVLGIGQGVDIWTGLVYLNGEIAKEGTLSLDHSIFIKWHKTGEMHTQNEWTMIYNETYPYEAIPETDGEIRNIFWQWDADGGYDDYGRVTGAWVWIGPFF